MTERVLRPHKNKFIIISANSNKFNKNECLTERKLQCTPIIQKKSKRLNSICENYVNRKLMDKKEFEEIKQKANKELNITQKCEQKEDSPFLHLQEEYPEYIGHYFRDYLKVLELQTKNGSKNKDLRDPKFTNKRRNNSFVLHKSVHLIEDNFYDMVNKTQSNSYTSFQQTIPEKNSLAVDIKLNNSTIKKTNICLPIQNEELKQKNHEHVMHCAQGLKIFKDKSIPGDIIQLGNNEIVQKNNDEKLKLLVLDMDETLMHTVHHLEGEESDNLDLVKEYEYIIPIKNQNDAKCNKLCINLRPHVRETLKELKKWYRIVIFTASVQSYADSILDFIDPNNEIFEARYYRHHCCVTSEKIHVKDMRIFEQPKSNYESNWNLREIIIVDNASHSFAYHISNGYPILPFYNDKQDKELIHMFYYLRQLATCEDVRPTLENTFVLRKLLCDNISKLIEGIVEYSVQEMTDEDMLLFDNFFSKANKINPISEPIKEEEQGQSVEVVIDNNLACPTSIQLTDIKNDSDVKVEEFKENDDFSQVSISRNQEIGEEEVLIHKSNDFEGEISCNFDTIPCEVTPKKKENTKMLKSSRVNQKLDEIRKRYMGNKRENKEIKTLEKSSLHKHNFVITNCDDYEEKEYFNSNDNEDLVIINYECLSSIKSNRFDNVQVLNSNISKGESFNSQRKWQRKFERIFEPINDY